MHCRDSVSPLKPCNCPSLLPPSHPPSVSLPSFPLAQVSSEPLRAIFNSTLMPAFPGSNLPGMEPVIAVVLPSGGKFALIELRTPEMATAAALQLSGYVDLQGRAMSVAPFQSRAQLRTQSQMFLQQQQQLTQEQQVICAQLEQQQQHMEQQQLLSSAAGAGHHHAPSHTVPHKEARAARRVYVGNLAPHLVS